MVSNEYGSDGGAGEHRCTARDGSKGRCSVSYALIGACFDADPILRERGLSGTEHSVLSALANRLNSDILWCDPGTKSLSKDTRWPIKCPPSTQILEFIFVHNGYILLVPFPISRDCRITFNL
jgi:hypothetical protein